MAAVAPRRATSVKGVNWGKIGITDTVVEFKVDNQLAFEFPVSEIAQSNVIAKSNEVAIELHQDDTKPEDSLVELRFVIPNVGEAPSVDGVVIDDATTVEGEGGESYAVKFHQAVVKKADIGVVTGQAIVSFEELPFVTPRGKYEVELHPTFINLHGKSYDYKVLYKHIARLFLLPGHDNRHINFVIALDPKSPLRRSGQTTYPFLVMMVETEEEAEVDINLTEEVIKEKYDGQLAPRMEGLTYRVVSKILKVLTGKQIIRPDTFVSSQQAKCIKCSFKADEGMLYPLEKYFFFLHKPTLMIKMDEIDTCEFSRQSSAVRTFDFILNVRGGGQYTFRNVPREEYQILFDFAQAKGLKVANLKKGSDAGGARAAAKDSDDEDHYRHRVSAAGGDDSESEDDDFVGDEGSESDPLENDSNAEPDSDEEGEGGDAAVGSPKRAKREEAADDEEGSEEEDDEDVIEVNPKEEEKKKKSKHTESSKKSSSKKEKETGKRKSDKDDGKKKKPKKDKDAPKGALSGFIIFGNDNRTAIKAENPSLSFTELGKLIGEKWKALSEEEKKPYLAKAEEDKKRYKTEMAAYEAKKKGSKSEVTEVDSD